MIVEEKTELVKAAEQLLLSTQKFDGSHEQQRKLLQKLNRMQYALETPNDAIMRQMDYICTLDALNVLTKMGILENIPTEGTITANKLAEYVGVDLSVITRSMRLVCAKGIAEEPEPDVYSHNEKSLAFISGTSQYLFKMGVDLGQSLMNLPEYLKTHTAQDFRDMKKSPGAYLYGKEGMTFYEVLSSKPDLLEMFDKSMVELQKWLPSTGMFPFASMKEQVQAEPDRPFIVDIAGGRGHVLMAIQEEAPAGFGSQMILQDRPEVLAGVDDKDLPNVTKMPYDMFQPQPVKNAHIYFMRQILHNYLDDVCVELVKNIASAMGPTSRLLISDFVVPEKTEVGTDESVYWMDFVMMMLTGKEKTVKEFEDIFNAAGLELVKVWPASATAHAVMEARLKKQ